MAKLEKSALAEHHKPTGHDIVWGDMKILGICVNWQKRYILKAWQINKTNNAINHDYGLKLPREYLSVVLKDKRNVNLDQVKA